MTDPNGSGPPDPEPDDGYGIPEQILRRMNHREWLLQFSQVLAVSPNSRPSADGSYRGMPMTPFRAGAITRLAQAAQYIRLLEQDVARLAEGLRASERDLQKTLDVFKVHMTGRDEPDGR